MSDINQVNLISERKDVISLFSSFLSGVTELKIIGQISDSLELFSTVTLLDCSLLKKFESSVLLKVFRNVSKKIFFIVPQDSPSEVTSKVMNITENYVPYPCNKEFFKDKFLKIFDNLQRNSNTIFKNHSAEEDALVRKTIIGESVCVRALRESIFNYAKSDGILLILGESGTGKTKTAELIHKLSRRRNANFLSVNVSTCTAEMVVSDFFGSVAGAYTDAQNRSGYFKKCDRGTLFLDEIGTMPLNMQPKLLKVMDSGKILSVGSDQEEEVDVRLIFATNDDLRAKSLKGEFRNDLFMRMIENVITIAPLRERREDIRILAETFAGEYGRIISELALKKLEDYRWPGNVRQLKSCIRRAINSTERPEILADDIEFLY